MMIEIPLIYAYGVYERREQRNAVKQLTFSESGLFTSGKQ